MIVFAERILIYDGGEDPQVRWWREELWLHKHDEIILLSGEELTDNIINAAQALLNKQFPQIVGFQDTIFAHNLNYCAISREIPSVQILHTG